MRWQWRALRGRAGLAEFRYRGGRPPAPGVPAAVRVVPEGRLDKMAALDYGREERDQRAGFEADGRCKA